MRDDDDDDDDDVITCSAGAMPASRVTMGRAAGAVRSRESRTHMTAKIRQEFASSSLPAPRCSYAWPHRERAR